MLGSGRGTGVAERPQDLSHDVPFGPHFAEGFRRRPEPLDAPLKIRERAVALDPRRRRQHELGQGAGSVGIRAREDQRLEGPEGSDDVGFRPRAVEQVVTEDPQRLDTTVACRLEDGGDIAVEADQLPTARVGVLVGANEQVVLVARRARRHPEPDVVRAQRLGQTLHRDQILVGHLR